MVGLNRRDAEGGLTSMEKQVLAWLSRQDAMVYLVGGCVRDRLLDRPVYDLDIVTDADGLALARRLADRFRGAYYPLDQVRGTGRAVLRDREAERLVVDVARLRGPDLAADLADRDFTVNALAANVRTPLTVVDQFHGLDDLEAGLIRPVSGTSIRDDPVRALRAVRLAAELGFSLAPQTEAQIRRDCRALSRVSSERIRDELARVLALSRAAPHLEHLGELGVLVVVLPELEPLRDLDQPAPHHLDVLAHSLETVRALEAILDTFGRFTDDEPDTQEIGALEPFRGRLFAHLDQLMSEARPRLVTVKLAALLHDTGKPASQQAEDGGRIRFVGHQQEGAEVAGRALRRLRLTNSEVGLGETIVRQHMRPLLLASQKSVSARAAYRFFRDTGEAGVDVLLHALADHRATYEPRLEDDRWSRLVALVARLWGDYWDRGPGRVDPPPLLCGGDLLREFGLQPGPQIGALLEAVREAQVSDEVCTRDEALDLVRRHLHETG
jgi:poly(A) polymerase